MAFLGKARKQDLVLLAEELGQKVSDKMRIIDLKNIIIGSKDYEEEFIRAQLSVILEEHVERETEEKIARQLCYESELNELRLQIESIRSNVKSGRVVQKIVRIHLQITELVSGGPGNI
ncbi:hypothetical protein TNCV_4660971 [Trichonephila clavipes]|uniref:Uncharacterized protein n=1 Tax=Trichonephila clavipes TaxID=2585209 RepID=A0A8X6SCL1_TRICX|nr:hypothetical protein TNCV_4660971 [Trichonephila clavipes]